MEGEVVIGNSKNAALKILAASILTNGSVKLPKLPEIEDIGRMKELLIDLGAKFSNDTVDASKIKKADLNYKIADRFRASIVLTGPILARYGRVSFPHPGGCTLGKRPINFFIDGFKTLGAKVKQRGQIFAITCDKLRGNKFVFPSVSVTGTETLMMAAVLANGKTILKNAACEPEIEELADFLNSAGAKISGAGTPTIEIDGVKNLKGGEWQGMPDRIEAGTFIILGIAAKSHLKVKNCRPDHLEIVLALLKNAGANLEIGKDYVIVNPVRSETSNGVKPAKKLKAIDVKTHEYPGLATDLQAPLTVLLTQADGASLVHETIYDGRLFYTDILNQMGANIIMADPHRVIVNGPSQLIAKKIQSPDIRAGMALIIAALIAKGQSIVENIYQIDRGYEKIDKKLRLLGADIKRIKA